MTNRKSTIRFSVDFENRQIVATNATLKEARRYGSDEYKELCKLMKAHPQFNVVAKEIKKNESKRAYHGLNYAFIENYISIQSDANSLMAEYEEIKRHAKQQGYSVYPYIKKWFLAKFSDFDMTAAREAITDAEYAAARSKAAA